MSAERTVYQTDNAPDPKVLSLSHIANEIQYWDEELKELFTHMHDMQNRRSALRTELRNRTTKLLGD